MTFCVFTIPPPFPSLQPRGAPVGLFCLFCNDFVTAHPGSFTRTRPDVEHFNLNILSFHLLSSRLISSHFITLRCTLLVLCDCPSPYRTVTLALFVPRRVRAEAMAPMRE